MDRQRQQAIESLDLSGDYQSVRCQSCSTFVPIVVGKITRLYPQSIMALKSQIKWPEQYHHGDDKAQLLKQEREELAQLLKEEESKELLRRLPLYSAPMTGYKYVCSKCWDQVCWLNERKDKKSKG